MTSSLRACRRALLALLATTAASPAAAQQTSLHDTLDLPDALTLKAGLRVRMEGLDNQFRPARPADDALLSLRAYVQAEYDAGRILAGGELRDARGYLERRNSSIGVSDANALEPVQFYVGLDLDGYGGKGAGGRLIVGRYTLETGAGRLIARPDFANSVNSYTGLLLDWHSAGKDRVVVFANGPSQRLPDDTAGIRDHDVTFDKAHDGYRFYGIDATKAQLLPTVLAEGYVYRLTERDAPGFATRDRRLWTYGVRLQRAAQAGRVDFEVEAANQTGRARASTAASDTAALPVDAHLLHGEVGMKFAGAWTPRLSLHGDLATGDDRDPTHYSRFDTLFGAPRVDFGPTSLYGAVNRANLRSVGLRAEVTPSPRWDAFAMARALWLDTPTDSFATTQVRDPSGRSGRHAGTQVEGRVRYWLIPRQLKLDVGGALLAKGRFLQDAPNAPSTGDTHYAFADLAFDF